MLMLTMILVTMRMLMRMMMMLMMKVILQVVLGSKDLAGRAKGIGRPAEPDFALVTNILITVIIIIFIIITINTIISNILNICGQNQHHCVNVRFGSHCQSMFC